MYTALQDFYCYIACKYMQEKKIKVNVDQCDFLSVTSSGVSMSSQASMPMHDYRIMFLFTRMSSFGVKQIDWS